MAMALVILENNWKKPEVVEDGPLGNIVISLVLSHKAPIMYSTLCLTLEVLYLQLLKPAGLPRTKFNLI